MPINPEHPAWKAWLAYKETASYRHALQSAPEGTLWGAFYEGWQARDDLTFGGHGTNKTS